MDRLLWVDGAARNVIEAPKLEPWIVRYELSDFEWAAIKPFLPNNGACSMASFGSCVQAHHGAICRFAMAHAPPATTAFVRWRRAGVWGRIMDLLAAAHAAAPYFG